MESLTLKAELSALGDLKISRDWGVHLQVCGVTAVVIESLI